MAASHPVPEPAFHTARDGVRLAYREVGEGRPVVLVHGYFSTAAVNWIRYGHADLLARHGFRVIMPDLRAHGDSAAPHDAAAYPPDVLTDDVAALVEHLGLDDYDLGGYSLGGRTVVRMLARGARPRRAIVAGMGWKGIVAPGARNAFFAGVFRGLGHHERGSAEWRSEAFLRTTGGDPVALELVLPTSSPTPPEVLDWILTPTLVLLGADDDDHGSGRILAERLPAGTYAEVPGNHMSAVARPELGEAMLRYLTEDAAD